MKFVHVMDYRRIANSLGRAAIGVVFVTNIVVHPGLVLVMFSALTVLLLIHEKPVAGVWLIVLLTPIETIGPLGFTATKSIKLALTVLVGIVLCADAWPRGSDHATDPYRWPFLLILFSSIPATLLATSPLNSAVGVVSILIFVLYYTGVSRSRELLPQAPRLLRAVLAGALLTCVLCISQMTYGYSGLFGSAEQQSVDTDQSYDTMWPTIFRASGAFNGPTAAGAFAAIGVIVAIAHVLAVRKSRATYSLAALLSVVGVLTTFSRGALLGTMAGTIFTSGLLIRWSPSRKLILVACLSGALATLLMSEAVRTYLRIGADIVSTSPSRIDAWQAAEILVKRHPVFGIGFYEFHAASQGISGTSETPLHPHNGALKMLVEQGPVGLLGYAMLLCTFLYTAKTSLACVTGADDRWVLGSIAGIGAGLFTQELFDAGFTIGNSSIAILFATLLGLQTALKYQLREPLADVPLRPSSAIPQA